MKVAHLITWIPWRHFNPKREGNKLLQNVGIFRHSDTMRYPEDSRQYEDLQYKLKSHTAL
jgi:hypothetical protein